MNKTLGITISDLKQSLQKALLSSGLKEQLRIKALSVGREIAEANRAEYPDIQSMVTKTGTWSWTVSFISPRLWSGIFGTRFKAGNEFDTRVARLGMPEGAEQVSGTGAEA